MKKQSTSRSAFFNPRTLIGFALCSIGLLLAVAGWSKSVTETIATKATAPTPGTWTATGSMSIGRQLFTATLLTNGKVLVAGSCLGAPEDPYCHSGATAGAELYDPSTGMRTPTNSMTIPRRSHTATLLATGKVLVAGGEGPGGAIASAEVCDPDTATWSATLRLSGPRTGHVASLITCGSMSGVVLLTGGSSVCRGCTPVLDSTELYWHLVFNGQYDSRQILGKLRRICGVT